MGALLLMFGLSDRGALETPGPVEAAEFTDVLRYGNGPDNTIGPVAPGAASDVLLGLSVPPFCPPPCYITRIEPDMVYWDDPAGNPDGAPANYNLSTSQGIWLHHDAVVNNCIANVFLSGNERTVYQAPPGYGSYVGVPGPPEDPNFCNVSWNLGWHIHNSGSVAHTVSLKFTVTYRTGETLTPLKGVGLNVATAQDAEYGIPTGYSDTHTCPSSCGTGINTDTVITAAQQGQIIAMGGHVHDYGYGVSALNVTRNEWLCTSRAGYGGGSRYLPTGGPGTPGHPAAAIAQTLDHDYHLQDTPDDAYHIQSMELCNVSAAGSILCTGDVIRVHAQYNNTSGASVPDAMGIMSAALPATPPNADGDGTWDGCDAGDSDGDEFSDRLEFRAGTQPNDACGVNAWPADINDDSVIGFGDIGMLTSLFGTTVPPAPVRRDIAPDLPNLLIDFGDIGSLTSKFGVSCTP